MLIFFRSILGILMVLLLAVPGIGQNTIINASNQTNVTEISKGSDNSVNTGKVVIDGKTVHSAPPKVEGTTPFGEERIRRTDLEETLAVQTAPYGEAIIRQSGVDPELISAYAPESITVKESVIRNQVNIVGGDSSPGTTVKAGEITTDSGVKVTESTVKTRSVTIHDDGEITAGDVRVSDRGVEAGDVSVTEEGVRVGSDISVTAEGVRTRDVEVTSEGVRTPNVEVSDTKGVTAPGVSVTDDAISAGGVRIDSSGVSVGGLSIGLD